MNGALDETEPKLLAVFSIASFMRTWRILRQCRLMELGLLGERAHSYRHTGYNDLHVFGVSIVAAASSQLL